VQGVLWHVPTVAEPAVTTEPLHQLQLFDESALHAVHAVFKEH
jgi:hypothetical protein